MIVRFLQDELVTVTVKFELSSPVKMSVCSMLHFDKTGELCRSCS